jgi:predicted dienelactone hydrolase
LVDDRIKRVITLDPALGHVSKADSLEIIWIKTLVIGAKNNDFLPYQQHAGRYAQLIDNATSISLDNGEGHFVFLDPCSHQYQAAGVSLCVDSQGVDRASVHKQLYPAIFEFIFRP